MFPYVKWIFPTAKTRETELDGGYHIPQWFFDYDLLKPEAHRSLQYEAICHIFDSFIDIIVAETGLVGEKKIFLGGYGEGCAIALSSFLSLLPRRFGDNGKSTQLAGFVGLSGWLPLRTAWLPKTEARTSLAGLVVEEVVQYINGTPRDAEFDREIAKCIGSLNWTMRDGGKLIEDPTNQDIVQALVEVVNAPVLNGCCCDTPMGNTGDNPPAPPGAIKAYERYPVFMGCIPKLDGDICEMTEKSAKTLADLGMDVRFGSLDVYDWWSNHEEIDAIRDFLVSKCGLEADWPPVAAVS